jgi:hypothetical protein
VIVLYLTDPLQQNHEADLLIPGETIALHGGHGPGADQGLAPPVLVQEDIAIGRDRHPRPKHHQGDRCMGGLAVDHAQDVETMIVLGRYLLVPDDAHVVLDARNTD